LSENQRKKISKVFTIIFIFGLREGGKNPDIFPVSKVGYWEVTPAILVSLQLIPALEYTVRKKILRIAGIKFT